MQHTFRFDGSFRGFLTVVQLGLQKGFRTLEFSEDADPDPLRLFNRDLKIETDTAMAKEIWRDLGLRGTEVQKRVYYSFLHKNKNLRPEIYQFIRRELKPEWQLGDTEPNARNSDLSRSTREVSREKELLEKRLRFVQVDEGYWYAELRSQHAVLPLLSRHCRNRFHSDPWIVIDRARHQMLSVKAGKLILSDTGSGNVEKFIKVDRALESQTEHLRDNGVLNSRIDSRIPKTHHSEGEQKLSLIREKKWSRALEQQAV